MSGGTSTAHLAHLVLQVIVYERDDLPAPVVRNPAAFDRVIWPTDTVAIAWPPAGEALDESAILAYAARKKLERIKRKPDDPTVL